MLSDLELNTLAGFFPRPHQRLLPVIQRAITYPPEEVYSSLKSFERKGIVDIVWLGGTTVFTLDVATDEALDGYLFYVRRKRDGFAARCPEVYETAMRYVDERKPEIALVLGEHFVGDSDESSLIAVSDAFSIIIITTDAERGPGREGETPDAEDIGKPATGMPHAGSSGMGGSVTGSPEIGGPVINAPEIGAVEYIRAEFRRMKKTDSDVLREIVNFAFPVRGAVPYFEFLYRDIGV